MKIQLLPYCLDPDEQHHVANLCLSVVSHDPTVEISAFDRTFPLRGADVPDVIHVHWPEHVLGNRGPRRYYRPIRQLLSLAWQRWLGAALVHTAHNLVPHDQELSRFDRRYLDAFDRLVDLTLVTTLSGTSELMRERPHLGDAPFAHVRLGLPVSPVPANLDRVAACERFDLDHQEPVIAFVGRVMRYKGVMALVDTWDRDTSQLLIAGQPGDERLAKELEEAVGSDDRARLVLRHLEQDELLNAITAATAIVTPFVQVFNSGSALLALSLGRRVLVPATPTFRELRNELGAEWVDLYEGARPTAEDLERAVRDVPVGRPDVAQYDWPQVGANTLAAYRMAAARRRTRTP